MTSHDTEFERNKRAKQRLLARWPKGTIRARYIKGLIRGEIELRLLPWLCDETLTSVDVGAYHGIYTLGEALFSKHVIAVEPQGTLARGLRPSLPLNSTLLEGALSNRSGTAMISMPVTDGDTTAALDFSTNLRDDVLLRREHVKLMRLDDISTERIGFIKIDVEGHELEVLEGAQRILSSDKPALLIEAEERHRAGSVEEVARLLGGFGYKGFFVCRRVVQPISEFRLATHQIASLVGSADRVSYGDYINNFVFVQRVEALPPTVPSAWHALATSLIRDMRRPRSP